MSEELARIEVMLKTVTETSQANSQKLDAIIERNAKADTALALVSQDMKQHHADDDSKFAAIEKKHGGYDKFIRGLLVFAIVELVGIVLFISIGK